MKLQCYGGNRCSRRASSTPEIWPSQCATSAASFSRNHAPTAAMSADDRRPLSSRGFGRSATTAVFLIDMRLPCVMLTLTRTSWCARPRGPAHTVIGRPLSAGKMFTSSKSSSVSFKTAPMTYQAEQSGPAHTGVTLSSLGAYPTSSSRPDVVDGASDHGIIILLPGLRSSLLSVHAATDFWWRGAFATLAYSRVDTLADRTVAWMDYRAACTGHPRPPAGEPRSPQGVRRRRGWRPLSALRLPRSARSRRRHHAACTPRSRRLAAHQSHRRLSVGCRNRPRSGWAPSALAPLSRLMPHNVLGLSA